MACGIIQRGVYAENYILKKNDLREQIKATTTSTNCISLSPGGSEPGTLDIADKVSSLDGGGEYFTDTWNNIRFEEAGGNPGPTIKVTGHTYIYAKFAGTWGVHFASTLTTAYEVAGKTHESGPYVAQVVSNTTDAITSAFAYHPILSDNAMYFITEGVEDAYWMAVVECDNMTK
jgi:hypothetical protein